MVKLMAQYIDKSALVTEIERLKSIQLSIFSKGETEESCYKSLSCISVYNEVLSLLDTLEVKEMDFDDFGFYWGEYVSNLGGDINNYEVAKYFYELGLKAQKGE